MLSFFPRIFVYFRIERNIWNNWTNQYGSRETNSKYSRLYAKPWNCCFYVSSIVTRNIFDFDFEYIIWAINIIIFFFFSRWLVGCRWWFRCGCVCVCVCVLGDRRSGRHLRPVQQTTIMCVCETRCTADDDCIRLAIDADVL